MDLRLLFLRCCFALFLLLSIIWRVHVQLEVELVWSRLFASSWYRSVYFETAQVVVFYIVLNYGFYAALYCWPATWKYRLDSLRYGKPFRGSISASSLLLPDGWKAELSCGEKIWLLRTPFIHAVTYMGPLVLLDSFTRKKYVGVDMDIWNSLPQNGSLQTFRLLPAQAPNFHIMALQVFCALVLYDLFFFFFHYALHSNALLYRLVHGKHHLHTSLVANHTDRLHIVERLAIVLGANEVLKILSAHPLTRTVFVFTFVFLLVDSHSGFDFPLNYDKIFPFMGGSKHHYSHHMGGSKLHNLAPFFVWTDAGLRAFEPLFGSATQKSD